ncbi:MAG TPA: hypothetical protein VF982_05690 [Anaerolineales bacterium]
MAMGGRTGRSASPSSPLELRLRHPHYLISHPVRFLLKPVIGRADGELGLQPGPAHNSDNPIILPLQGRFWSVKLR